MKKLWEAAALAAAVVVTCATEAPAQTAAAADPAFGKTMGIVFMHGRGAARPEDADVVGPLTASMRAYGVTVVAPVMPWAGDKGVPNYSGTLQDGLQIVAAEVQKLRAKGLKKLFVGGMSEGGRAAIAYGGFVGDVDGIVAIAPSPDAGFRFLPLTDPVMQEFLSRTPPERRATLEKMIQGNLQKLQTAREMVAAGRGKERATFSEINTGHSGVFEFRITLPAEVYLTHIDPDGPGNMRLSASKFPPTTALFIAQDDLGIDRFARIRVFNAAPKNERNLLFDQTVPHLAAPRAARDAVKTWLAQFAE